MSSISLNFISFIYVCIYPCGVTLLVSHRVVPRVADRGMLARYGGYRGNKIPRADRNQYRYLAVDREICKA
jgi:hypothetical protein